MKDIQHGFHRKSLIYICDVAITMTQSFTFPPGTACFSFSSSSALVFYHWGPPANFPPSNPVLSIFFSHTNVLFNFTHKALPLCILPLS